MTDYPHRCPAPRGFTLIELVAVMAIFSLVAIISVQALSGALRQRDVLTRIEAEATELAQGFALLRSDLGAMIPATFQPARGGTEPAFDYRPDAGRLAFSIGGQPRFDDERRDGLARVVWQFDAVSGVLTRQVTFGLNPRATSPALPPETLFTGVDRLEVLTPEAGAGDGAPGPDSDGTVLPEQVELVITSRRHGPLRVVVAP